MNFLNRNLFKRARMNNSTKTLKLIGTAAALALLVLMYAGPACAAPPRHPASTVAQPAQNAANDSDKSLAAMQDELERSRSRLVLKIPGTNEPAHPYYIQYRVLDLDVRTIVA